MAIRREDLAGQRDEIVQGEGALLIFPTVYARRRAARQMRVVYLRRRLAVLGVGLLIVSALILAAGPGGVAPASSRAGSPPFVTLQPGETLWELALQHAPESVDPRAYVDALIRMNNIEGSPQAGRRLQLP